MTRACLLCSWGPCLRAAVVFAAVVLGAGLAGCSSNARVRVANRTSAPVRVTLLRAEADEDRDAPDRAAADVAPGGIFELVRHHDTDLRPFWRVRIDCPARDGRVASSFISPLGESVATDLVVGESNGVVTIGRGR